MAATEKQWSADKISSEALSIVRGIHRNPGTVDAEGKQYAHPQRIILELDWPTSRPVPAAVALDGIAEFIGISHGTADPWPHERTRIGLHAAEGESWLLDLTASGSRVIDDHHETAASLHGSASNLLLTLHGRLALDNLRSEGDRATLENLLHWPDLG